MAAFNRESTGVQVVTHFKDKVEGKTIVITGASQGGLGAEAALSLAHASPAQILLLARSATKVQPVIDEIGKLSSSTKATFVPIELDDFDSVRKAASTINSSIERIDYLLNCAGIMGTKTYTTNKAGIEAQFATNHLGHFLLTSLLYPKLQAAGPAARIVNVTSDGYKIGPCRLADYNFKDGTEYDGWSGYGQSKTANILFTRSLAAKGITSFAPHPGVIMSTSLSRDLAESDFAGIADAVKKNNSPEFEVGQPKSKQQAAAALLVPMLDDSILSQNGSYLEDCQCKDTFDYAKDMNKANELWEISEKLVGQKFDI